MELKNKVMNLYEEILEPVKARKIVTLLKYVVIDGETDIGRIQREIPIKEETIKKYVDDDDLMLKYLNKEELELFRNKMNKILNQRHYKIRKLIELILIKNETDLSKIQRSIPIGIETINKYLENKQDLLKYMTEEELQVFLSRLEPIMEKTRKKLQRLIKCVLVDGETDLDVIEKKAYIKINTIKKHLENPKELERYLTEEELELFVNKVNQMFEKRESKIAEEELQTVKKIVDEIFNTRYRYIDICSRNFTSMERFETYLNNKEYMNRNFPDGTVERVKSRIEETGLIREKKPRDHFIIEDRVNIYYAKEGIFFLTQFDNKRLNFASYYLASGGNLELVMKKFESSMPVTLGVLSDPKIEQILKPEYYAILEKYIKIEKILVENNLLAKKELVIQITKFLEENNFDNELAMAYFKMPECLFNKLLVEIVKLPNANNETKLEIKKLLNDKEEKIVK